VVDLDMYFGTEGVTIIIVNYGFLYSLQTSHRSFPCCLMREMSITIILLLVATS